MSVCGEEPLQHAADDGRLEELIDAARKVIQQRPLEAQQTLQAAAAAFEQSADDKLCGQYCQLLGQVGAMTDDCEQAEAWALRGLDHFRKCGFRRGEAAILNILGILASKRADYAASIRYESDTLHICQELEFHGGIGHAANNVGLSFSYLGDFETALEYYQISLEAWKEQPEDSIGKGNVLLNLGFAMKQLERPEDAMGYYYDAEEEFTKAGYARGLVIVWRNMATALIALQQPEEALEVALRAVEQVRELGEQSRTAMVLEGYGEALAANGRADEAIVAYQEAAELYSKTGVMRGQVFTLQQWARLPCARIESKLELLNRALELARKAGIKVEQAILHKEIADAYRAAGQWQSAVEHLERHIEMNRQVFTEKADLKARTLRIHHEFERARKDAEIERLRNVELAAALDEAEAMGRVAAEESRQKTEILHIVAHDLRNYTSALIGTAEVAIELVREEQVSGELVDMLESFGLSAAHLDAMLEQMLDLSAVESGKININLSEFRLWELVEERMRTWSGRAAVKQQRMELAGESAHQVRADRMLTAEILENLVTNALKYSPAASVVRIEVGATAGQISCTVLDQGPGISAADQPKLYRPFQKLSARPTGGESAIGLGLYISRNLAQLQGGDVRYRDRQGGGGCFELLLPKS